MIAGTLWICINHNVPSNLEWNISRLFICDHTSENSNQNITCGINESTHSERKRKKNSPDEFFFYFSSSIYFFKLSALFRHVCLPMSSASQTLTFHFALHVCGICDVSVECGACLSMHCIFKPAHVQTMIIKAQDWMRIMSSVYGESRIKIIISTKCMCVHVFCASAVTTTFWTILKYIHVHIL